MIGPFFLKVFVFVTVIMKSFLLALALHASVVAGADLCDSSLQDYQQVCGEATGNFQLLGSLCFPGGDNGEKQQSSVTFALSFADVDSTILPLATLNQYYVLFYDDQSDSFPAVNRITSDGNFQNCSERESLSKGICSSSGTDCVYGWHVVSTLNKTTSGSVTTYYKTITISEAWAREWFFVLSACDISTSIQLHSYSISSDAAVDCSDIYSYSDGGYIAAVVILVIVLVVLAATSFIFYKRTKIPELLSMVCCICALDRLISCLVLNLSTLVCCRTTLGTMNCNCGQFPSVDRCIVARSARLCGEAWSHALFATAMQNPLHMHRSIMLKSAKLTLSTSNALT